MGWCSGTDVASTFVDLCDKYVPRQCQEVFLKKAFTELENMDWDCQHDLFGGKRPIDKLAEKVLKKMNPDWYDDEGDDRDEGDDS